MLGKIPTGQQDRRARKTVFKFFHHAFHDLAWQTRCYTGEHHVRHKALAYTGQVGNRQVLSKVQRTVTARTDDVVGEQQSEFVMLSFRQEEQEIFG